VAHIVGVAANVKHSSLRERPDFELYRPISPDAGLVQLHRDPYPGDSESLIAALRRRVASSIPSSQLPR
jgi:hypothetical protein